jgi:hypothetical protein
MDIQRILIEYAKLHLQVVVLQEQNTALQAQLAAKPAEPAAPAQQ